MDNSILVFHVKRDSIDMRAKKNTLRGCVFFVLTFYYKVCKIKKAFLNGHLLKRPF